MPGTNVQGAHSALWLYPNSNLYGAWPNSGEIDVGEWYSAIPDHVYPSVHYAWSADAAGRTTSSARSSRKANPRGAVSRTLTGGQPCGCPAR